MEIQVRGIVAKAFIKAILFILFQLPELHFLLPDN